MEVVRSNFNSIVRDPKKDVYIMYYGVNENQNHDDMT